MKMIKHGDLIRITPAKVEKKLQFLCECGFKIVPPYSCEDILRVFEKMVDKDVLDVYSKSSSFSLEQDTLEVTIFLLGEDYKEDDDDYEYGRCYCENLWYTDFEYVCDDTYLDAIERMIKITRGALKLDSIKSWYSEEDDENGRVWISFEFRGKEYKFSYELKKWFDDVGLLIPIIKLLEIADPTKIFAYHDFGEMCAIICISKGDLEKLNKQRGINFKPLGQKFEKA